MKIGIIGSGLVGSTAAYAMVMHGVGRYIVLVDRNRQLAEAQAADINHAVPFAHPLEVWAGDYSELNGCRVIIIAAGVNQKPGETRLQLLERNRAVFEQVVPEALKHAPGAVLLVATNPVDVMTHLTARIAARFDVPPSHVLGSGTTLDTARFRYLLGRHFDIDSHHVHAYVLGEHGDSEVLTWSTAKIAGMSLAQFGAERGIALDEQHRRSIDEQVRRAAYVIIEGKGATYYGIGSALARITGSILHDRRSVLTVCAPTEEVLGVRDTTISVPRIVGGDGVLGAIRLTLDDAERAALARSAQIIRDLVASLGNADGAA